MLNMPPTKPKRRISKVFYSFPVVLILSFFAFASIRGAIDSYKMHKAQEKKYNGSIEDLSALQKREAALRAENEWLKTSRGQEELFREQYMVAKEGENVMVITAEDKLNEEHTVTEETKTDGLINKTKAIISGE